MKHDWREHPYGNPADDMLKEPRRRCANCGAVQARTVEHLWMRVTGYRWVPLAGRCKGNTRLRLAAGEGAA